MDFIVYIICFGVGLLFTIVTGVFSHLIGGGHDGHADVDVSGSHMPGISPLSPTTIASFLTAFGGLGMILSRFPSTSSPWISAPLAILGALLIATAVFLIFNKIFRSTQSSSESQVASLIGLTATAITPIPENGVGEIAYVQAGSRYTAPAREDKGTAVSTGSAVKITRIVGSQFYVSIQ